MTRTGQINHRPATKGFQKRHEEDSQTVCHWFWNFGSQPRHWASRFGDHQKIDPYFCMLVIKRAVSEGLRDQIYHLRYKAYRSVEAVSPNGDSRFSDHYDTQPNHILWVLTKSDRVIGSIRSTWWSPSLPYSIPEIDGYGEHLAPISADGRRLFSGNRFVIDPDLSEKKNRVVLTLLRFHMFAATQHADYALAAVREQHVNFYSRTLRLKPISPEKQYPGLSVNMLLCGGDYGQNIGRVYDRTSSIKPVGYERVFLDENYRDLWEIGVPIK